MKIKIPGKTAEQTKTIVHIAANQTGHFRLDDDREIGNYYKFVLRMREATPTRRAEREDPGHPAMKYRKRGHDLKRWTGAVCWHGHKEFMERLFAMEPTAIIRTCRSAYIGIEGFKANHQATGSENVGSMFMPVQYRECCDCFGG